MAQAPIAGTIFTDVRGGVGVTGNSGAKKVGTATCKGILGFAAGDCSIEAAMKNGNITKIHHVDSDTKNVLGIYAEYTVKVFGE
ncbi:MAG: hypothetical protein HYS23_05435 [Geobacter sp.]|nr:hypothetical protein [Geobacter sp.]